MRSILVSTIVTCVGYVIQKACMHAPITHTSTGGGQDTRSHTPEHSRPNLLHLFCDHREYVPCTVLQSHHSPSHNCLVYICFQIFYTFP